MGLGRARPRFVQPFVINRDTSGDHDHVWFESRRSHRPPRRRRHVINHLTSGGRVANLSIATDESYIDRNSGQREERTEWHRVVSFQPGLIDMLEKHARKGRLVYVSGKLQTRRWKKDGEDSDRFSTEILLAPGGRIQFLERPNGANGSNGTAAPEAVNETAVVASVESDEIPF